jgi:hypothetical protein
MVRDTKIQKGLVKRKNSFYRYLSKQNKVLPLVEMTKKYFLKIPIRSLALTSNFFFPTKLFNGFIPKNGNSNKSKEL